MMMKLAPVAGIVCASLAAAMCSGGATASTPTSPTAGSTTTTTTTPVASLPAIYQQFGNGVQVSLAGDVVVVRTTDVPDHPSPYFGAGNANYEPPHAGMTVNPHRIASQNITFRIPARPAAAAPSDTPLGPIGIATNGVVLFNQYAAGRMPLTGEIFSFDRFNGHPAPSNQYHYHVEPVWLTAARGKATFIGVLLDGFPVYGSQDADGSTPANLDGCNGHAHATPDYPSGTYHYHVTSAPPYIAGCFHGAPGTVAG